MKDIRGLRHCEWQYQIRHEQPNAFDIGECVFLKSNPEWPLIVYTLDDTFVYVVWKDIEDTVHADSFPPQAILQYRYAGLLIWRNSYRICLN